MQFPLQTIDQLQPLVQGFRKRAGLTQAAMAEKLGITQQSYAQIESNLGSTSVERLYTILRLLDVELHFQALDAEDALVMQAKRSPDTNKAAILRPAKPRRKKPANVWPQAIEQTDKTQW